jgi:small subunit ribosomal protein S13
MVRIAGVIIPDNKRVEIGLTYIYGIGKTKSTSLLDELKVDKNIRVKDLTPEEVAKISALIAKKHTVEGDLRRQVSSNIKRLKDISSYRGSRHYKRLPIKARTKTNSRTVRGNVRRTAGSGKRSLDKT